MKYRVGDLSVDTGPQVVSRDGVPIALPKLSYELLLVLARAAPNLISPDELMRLVWPGIVVSPETVSQRIKLLRDALDDDPREPRYIAGLRGRGYQMVAAVKELEADSTANPETATLERSTPHPEPPAPRPESRRNRLLLIVVVAGVAIALVWFLAVKVWIPKQIAQERPVTATAALISEKSLAVLPFVDMSEKKDQEYFADGMAEEIIDLLAKVPNLRVPARTSSFYFKDKPTKVPEIARELGVAHVLEGSIRRSGNQIRVTAQLIRADNGYHLWSETYDRKLDDIFKIQDEIAGAVVKALKVSLLIDALPRATPTSSTEAYTLYLQAISMGKNHPTRLSVSKAVDYLQQAVKLDAKFAPAWAILSRLLVDEVAKFGVLPREQGREQALRAAETAVGLDSKLPEAHIAIGKILYQFDWDWSAAEAEFGKARDLDPGNGDALRWSGYVATTLGRLDDALRLAQQSIAVDPLYEYNYVGAAKVYLALGRIHEAEAAYRKAIDLNTADAIPHIGLADTFLARGEPAPALAEMQQVSLDDGQTIGLAIVYHAMGRKRESDAVMVEAEMKHPKDNIIGIAAAHAYRGETDQAFAWLNRAFQERDTRIVLIKTDPYLKSLVADPRYKALLRKMNLPE
jgi:TolB-like protein/DNA-binding winged helix-turn-helix (wHTH) protein/Flp pilus assembly protein TadD